ncbi:MAG: ATP cone domain-containing protein, partial [bacterium]|nr:ATP cone domain-containing protein [bacterium]
MIKVIKRDGEIAGFDLSKISNAITKAFKATSKQFDEDIIN